MAVVVMLSLLKPPKYCRLRQLWLLLSLHSDHSRRWLLRLKTHQIIFKQANHRIHDHRRHDRRPPQLLRLWLRLLLHFNVNSRFLLVEDNSVERVGGLGMGAHIHSSVARWFINLVKVLTPEIIPLVISQHFRPCIPLIKVLSTSSRTLQYIIPFHRLQLVLLKKW